MKKGVYVSHIMSARHGKGWRSKRIARRWQAAEKRLQTAKKGAA